MKIKVIKKISLIVSILIAIIPLFSMISYGSSSKQKEPTSNYLTSLSIEGFSISPAFDKNVTEYICSASEDSKNFNVIAVPEDENASVKITGNDSIRKAEGTIKVVVTPKVGNTKTYKINVVKQKENNLTLDAIEISRGAISPAFDKQTYYYNAEVKISDEGQDIEIIATPTDSTTKVEIVGNQQVKEGQNIISIILEDSEGKITTYQINTIVKIEKVLFSTTQTDLGKKVSNVKDFFNNEKNILYILIGIAVILLICIIAVIKSIIHADKIKKNKEKLKKRAK